MSKLNTLLIAVEQDPLWNDFFYTQLTTGLRLGKICGLMWSDFDERKGVINIRPNTQMSYGRRIYQHIIPALGDIQLDRLTTGDIQQFTQTSKKAAGCCDQRSTVKVSPIRLSGASTPPSTRR